MNRTLGIALIFVGLAALLYGGLTYTMKESIADIGPIHVSRDKTHNIPYSPIAGGLCVVAGIALVATSKRSSAAV